MVHYCGVSKHPATERLVGGDIIDLRKLFFMFENVTTRGK